MTAEPLHIAGRRIASDTPAYVIAEVAQAHDGSLGAAHAFIDIAADCGADAIKFQTHFAEAESTREEPFRVKFTTQDATRFDYWQRLEFTERQWRELAGHAADRGLTFLSSAFSMRAIDLLQSLDMAAWKIASGEVWNDTFMQAMTATGKPVLLSTGMANWEEIGAAVDMIRAQDPVYPLGIFQCTSMYPTPLTHVGLNVLDALATRFQVQVGLSDHTGGLSAPMAAMAQGARLIEVHLALHAGQFGPDTVASLTPDALAQLCRFRDDLAVMEAAPVDKDARAQDLGHMRQLFSRSLALVAARPAGHVLTAADLTAKKPGSGIDPQRLPDLVGRRLSNDVPADRLLRDTDF